MVAWAHSKVPHQGIAQRANRFLALDKNGDDPHGWVMPRTIHDTVPDRKGATRLRNMPERQGREPR